jgi:hypothetical protein
VTLPLSYSRLRGFAAPARQARVALGTGDNRLISRLTTPRDEPTRPESVIRHAGTAEIELLWLAEPKLAGESGERRLVGRGGFEPP